MRTNSTIISLLLLVACANATKSVSYSDIVYSLMELNDDNKSLESFTKINLSLTESKEKLNTFDAKLKERCVMAQQSGSEKLQNQGRQIISLEESKIETSVKQAEIRFAQEAAKTIVASSIEEIKKFNELMNSEKASYLTNEKKRAERYMIFKRLISFVEDELESNEAQRKTKMDTINVDKSFTGKTAFVQMERIRSDLTNISAKTADPITKSIITTLLMITQSSNKYLFVNPELVAKIKNLIAQLMDKEQESDQAESKAVEKNVANYKAIITVKTRQADLKKQEEIMNVAELASLEQTVRNIENEVKAYTRAQERQRKKNAIQDQMCQKQDQLIKLHFNDLGSFEAQFKDLQNNLA